MSKLFIIEVTTKSQFAVAVNVEKVDSELEKYIHNLNVPEYLLTRFANVKLNKVISKTIDVSGDDLKKYKCSVEIDWKV